MIQPKLSLLSTNSPSIQPQNQEIFMEMEATKDIQAIESLFQAWFQVFGAWNQVFHYPPFLMWCNTWVLGEFLFIRCLEAWVLLGSKVLMFSVYVFDWNLGDTLVSLVDWKRDWFLLVTWSWGKGVMFSSFINAIG